MAFTPYTMLQGYNTAHTITADTPGKAAFGDLLDGWNTHIEANFDVIVAMLTLPDAYILIGNGTNGYPASFQLSGDVRMNNAGVVTIQPYAVTGGKIASNTITNSNITPATITGASIASATVDTTNLTTNARFKEVTTETPLNLATTGTYLIAYFEKASTLLSAQLIYSTAASATAASLTIDKPGTVGYFVASTSTTASAAQYAVQALTLANTAIAAGDMLIFNLTTASGATGTVQLHYSYYVN